MMYRTYLRIDAAGPDVVDNLERFVLHTVVLVFDGDGLESGLPTPAMRLIECDDRIIRFQFFRKVDWLILGLF